MNPATFDTDVLVVGAGPTGMTAAAELARRGIAVRLIDKEPRRSDKSRALIVHARTLEVLNDFGLADARQWCTSNRVGSCGQRLCGPRQAGYDRPGS